MSLTFLPSFDLRLKHVPRRTADASRRRLSLHCTTSFQTTLLQRAQASGRQFPTAIHARNDSRTYAAILVVRGSVVVEALRYKQKVHVSRPQEVTEF
jgi:hypothetical protein